MKNRNLWRSIFALSAMVTLIGLGFTAYNHFVLHQPFMNQTTKGLLSAFFPKSCHGCNQLVQIKR